MTDPPGFRWMWEDPETAEALRKIAHSMARTAEEKAAEALEESRQALAAARAERPRSHLTAQMRAALARIHANPPARQRREP